MNRTGRLRVEDLLVHRRPYNRINLLNSLEHAYDPPSPRKLQPITPDLCRTFPTVRYTSPSPAFANRLPYKLKTRVLRKRRATPRLQPLSGDSKPLHCLPPLVKAGSL